MRARRRSGSAASSPDWIGGALAAVQANKERPYEAGTARQYGAGDCGDGLRAGGEPAANDDADGVRGRRSQVTTDHAVERVGVARRLPGRGADRRAGRPGDSSVTPTRRNVGIPNSAAAARAAAGERNAR